MRPTTDLLGGLSVAAGVALAILCGAAGRGAGETPAAPAGPNGILTLTLAKALPNERDLAVYLDCRGGRVAVALAKAPAFGRTAYDVDASGLAVASSAVKGPLSVTLHSDGYNPPIGKTVRCVFQVDAKASGTQVAGVYDGLYGVGEDGRGGAPIKGAVSGTAAPRWAPDGLVVLDLDMINAEGNQAMDGKVLGRRGHLMLVYKAGRCLQAILHGHGDARQINYFEAVVKEAQLTWGEGALRGAVAVRATEGQTYVYAFDGKLVGGQVGGSFTKKVDGKDAPGGRFSGTLEPMPTIPPASAIYNVELLGAVTGGRQLNVFVPCKEGAFGAGIGYSGKFNHTFHDVDPAALKRKGDALGGDVQVTINADPYVPPDGKPIACRYTLDAKVQDGCILGTFAGKFGQEDVSGRVLGRLLPLPPVPEPAQVSLKLDDGVNEGAPWLRRVYVGFVAAGGRAGKGSMSNNKGGWQGTFRSASVEFDGSTFRATIEGTVDTSRGPKTGAYTFKLTGRAVGGELVGAVETYRDGQLTKKDTAFMGSIRPVE